jgi:hypothetical protein
MMNTKTLVIAAAVIAATASLALVPTFTSTAMADAGGINHREDVCTHNGTDEEINCETETHGKNFEETTTCKVKGVETTPCPT